MRHLSKKSSFMSIVEGFSGDLEHQGIYGKENKQKALDMALNEVLEGYRDLEEAKDHLQSMKETGNIYFTARGLEVNADALEEAIRIKEGTQLIPPELQFLAEETRKYKSVEEFVNNVSKILKEITTNEIRSLTPSIGKGRAGRVMITRYHGTNIELGVMVPWEKTTTLKHLAHGKREILKYLTDFYNQVKEGRHISFKHLD